MARFLRRSLDSIGIWHCDSPIVDGLVAEGGGALVGVGVAAVAAVVTVANNGGGDGGG